MIRLLVDPPQSGARNMAVDEALLQAMAGGASPVLRLYGFRPACISLGRFQPAADVIDPQRLRDAGIGLVRRPTGGRAVLHDDEVTYAIILGRHLLEPFTKRAAYRAAAAMLLELLPALGVRAAVQTAGAGAGAPGAVDPDCYRTTSEYEIVSAGGGRKLVGSAQTMRRDASLQHGTIPLSPRYTALDRYLRRRAEPAGAQRPAAPAAPAALAAPPAPAASVAGETGRRWEHAAAQHALAAAAVARLDARRSALTAAEQALAHELEHSRYRCPAWTRAR